MQNKIIHFLKSSPNYISGEEISRQIKISRAGIWKYIQVLRDEGYDIVAVPHLGYKLISAPDKLLPSEIQFGLATKILGKKIVYFDSIGSTMDYAFQLGMQGAEEGTVVCAESQSKGRGRMGRNWASPKGKGIYMSVILRPKLSPTDVAQLTLLSAVAICEVVKKVCSVKATIKWPNDLLVHNMKLAGILTELSAEMDRVRFVVIGIGLNVNTPVSLLPTHSTSLKNETKQQISRIEVFQEILRHLEKWYEDFKMAGSKKMLQRWKEYSSTLGRRVRVVDTNGHVEGEAIGLDQYGGLIIRNDEGMIVKRMTGDVVQVR